VGVDTLLIEKHSLSQPYLCIHSHTHNTYPQPDHIYKLDTAELSVLIV
jgi:hypothetical protein